MEKVYWSINRHHADINIEEPKLRDTILSVVEEKKSKYKPCYFNRGEGLLYTKEETVFVFNQCIEYSPNVEDDDIRQAIRDGLYLDLYNMDRYLPFIKDAMPDGGIVNANGAFIKDQPVCLLKKNPILEEMVDVCWRAKEGLNFILKTDYYSNDILTVKGISFSVYADHIITNINYLHRCKRQFKYVII